MTSLSKDEGERRGFLRGVLRAAALAVAGAAGGILGARTLVPGEGGETCRRDDGWCRRCRLISDCRLPKAQSARRVLGEK